MKVSFYKPDIDDREVASVTRALRHGMIGTGPLVAIFEKEFMKYIGASNAIAVNSASSALHLAVDALGIGPGDEVITTALTFTSTVLAIIYTGATPVLADIDQQTLCIDPESVEKKITPRTKAILPVHYAGIPCNMDRMVEICKKYDLALIEDAAHALPSDWNGKRIGSDRSEIKNIVCFSFQATKTLSIGDGGMLTTADDKLADIIRMKRLFGMKRKMDFSNTDIALQYGVEILGYKYNMTDIEAAIGRIQLEKLEKMEEKRNIAAMQYEEKLSSIKEIDILRVPDCARSSRHLFVILVKDSEKRNFLLEYLGSKGITASVHFIPFYNFPYFQDMFKDCKKELVNTEDVSGRVVSLPFYPDITREQIDYVCDEIRLFFKS